MKKYIYRKKISLSNLWNNSSRSYDFLFKVHISDIAWIFLLFHESSNILHVILK